MRADSGTFSQYAGPQHGLTLTRSTDISDSPTISPIIPSDLQLDCRAHVCNSFNSPGIAAVPHLYTRCAWHVIVPCLPCRCHKHYEDNKVSHVEVFDLKSRKAPTPMGTSDEPDRYFQDEASAEQWMDDIIASEQGKCFQHVAILLLESPPLMLHTVLISSLLHEPAQSLVTRWCAREMSP